MLKGFKVEGVQTTLRAMGKARTKDAIAIDEGLNKCAEILLRASLKLVPRDTGLLASTGHVERGAGKGFAATASVVYDAPYAVPVHEDLTAHHESPTQARYLSDAVPKVRGTMVSVLQRQLRASQV